MSIFYKTDLTDMKTRVEGKDFFLSNFQGPDGKQVCKCPGQTKSAQIKTDGFHHLYPLPRSLFEQCFSRVLEDL